MADVPLPKHLQISEALIRDLRAGRLADGARLPPEREMAAAHGVAVGTLRKALADLTRLGLLERRQGSGNYVRLRPGPVGIYGFFRLERAAGGGLPTAEVLSLERAGLHHRIRRLRRLDGVLVAAEEIAVSTQAIPALTPELCQSLYLHYRQDFGIEIARVEDRVSLGEMPGWATGLPPGPCGLVLRLACDGAGREVERSRTWFDPTQAFYVNRMELG